ncbi:MAG: zinc-ribbon domain-containing protein, partial [Gemmatimonadota bacterium]|nr:zinc-ribbon domain-containing protein [Gemmatimonadota bacterium]
MNVTCPECRSVFRVDPSKLPAALVRARCAVCGGLITVMPASSVRDEFAPPRAESERVPADFPAAGAGRGFARSDTYAPSATTAAPPAQPAPTGARSMSPFAATTAATPSTVAANAGAAPASAAPA